MSEKRFGLIGAKLGHSLSPAIHAKLGSYRYDLIELTPEALPNFLTHGDFQGLNVTIPYKKTVIPFCTVLTPRAKAIGSVNTLVRLPDGGLLGDNTDYAGFLATVKKSGVNPQGKKCLVLGSGGASLTAVAVLREAGASQVVVISRSGPDNYTNLDRHADAALIVNTTPVGMYPACDASPLESLDGFPALEGVIDIVYNPLKTNLLLMAEKRGLPAVNGLRMLVTQAAVAAEHFAGRTVDQCTIDGILADMENETANLVLIGMPGCGKSTIGNRLAARLHRDFLDTDRLITERDGRPIPQIFAEDGEAFFRALETEVIRDLSMRTGLVIATGGGAPLREVNRDLLKRNGRLIWLNRPIDRLPTHGRPLSQQKGVETLFKEREPVYRAAADREIVNLDADTALGQILNK